MKTEFNLSFGKGELHKSGVIRIIGTEPEYTPYVAIYLTDPLQLQTQTACWIEDKDLEIFAVNILKAIKSKKLKGVSNNQVNK